MATRKLKTHTDVFRLRACDNFCVDAYHLFSSGTHIYKSLLTETQVKTAPSEQNIFDVYFFTILIINALNMATESSEDETEIVL